MKAILASHDITMVKGGIETVEKMTSKSRKDINVAIINEAAAVEFGDQRWAVNLLTNIATNFGGNIEFVHLLAIPLEKIRERIAAADMVLVVGGSADWQKVVFEKSGFATIVPEVLKEKLYIGSSAGSMILGHRPSDKIYGQLYGRIVPDLGVKNFLDIFDFSILPHLYEDEVGVREEWAIEESKAVTYPVYALSDKAAIVVDGDEISVIGEDYMKLFNGENIS